MSIHTKKFQQYMHTCIPSIMWHIKIIFVFVMMFYIKRLKEIKFTQQELRQISNFELIYVCQIKCNKTKNIKNMLKVRHSP